MKTPTYPFTPLIAVRICQRHLRVEERSARRAAVLQSIMRPIALIAAPIGLTWLLIQLRAKRRAATRQQLRRPTGLRLHRDFRDLPL